MLIQANQRNKAQQSTLQCSQNQLPHGTCTLQIKKKLQQYNIILSYQLSQYLTFPYQSKYFPCVIVKENIQRQEPVYHLFYELQKKRLLSAQKQPNNIGCNYIISKKQKPEKNEYFVGKLRGNFRNNEFIIYDGGQNPKKKCVRKRKQLGSIQYVQQSIFSNQKSSMQILIPSVQQRIQSCDQYPKYYPHQFIPRQQKQNMLYNQYRKGSPNVIRLGKTQIECKNIKQITSNPISTATMVQKPYLNLTSLRQDNANFKANQKNNRDEKPESFEFKLRGKNSYQIKIGYPLNIIQGFGIALSIIQRRSI